MADSSLPDVHFGAVDRKVHWQKVPDIDLDDDEELPVTPKHVVHLLGFDPLEKDE